MLLVASNIFFFGKKFENGEPMHCLNAVKVWLQSGISVETFTAVASPFSLCPTVMKPESLVVRSGLFVLIALKPWLQSFKYCTSLGSVLNSPSTLGLGFSLLHKENREDFF